MIFISKTVIGSLMVVSMTFFVCAAYGGSDSCRQAKELWKERIATDAQLRMKRADLQQKIIDNKIMANEMERKMAAVEMEVLKAPEKERDALWAQYDLISEERDELTKEIEPIYKEYAKVSSERSSKKLRFKTRQMEKRYECIVNEELGAKLNEISKKIDDANFEELLKQRAAIIDYIKGEYRRHQKELIEKTSLYEKSSGMLEKVLQDEEVHDHEREKYSDEISDIFDKWQNTIDRYGDQISNISEQLLPYTKK